MVIRTLLLYLDEVAGVEVEHLAEFAGLVGADRAFAVERFVDMAALAETSSKYSRRSAGVASSGGRAWRGRNPV
jgi:hypothetical protein